MAAVGMSFVDLVLLPSCEGCNSSSDLYATGCRHMTLCTTCAKAMCRSNQHCNRCPTPITKLIREYNVRASASTDKSFSIGRFVTGLPPFSKKKNAENKWTLQKEGLQGRKVTEANREKLKNKPWLLEDETGQHQYQGQVEGAQSATYFLLVMMPGNKEFLASPAGSWYNFNKIAQYKQLTLEEAEEKMNKRKNNATGYERWMMKAATNGPSVFGGQAVFGDVKKGEGMDSGGADGNRSRKGKDGEHSDKGEEGEEEDNRKSRPGLNQKGLDDDEDGGRGDDFDLDDEIEKGDDWEHEETFTDDDETNNIDPLENEDLAPEIPAPPEIKEDDDEEEEDDDDEEEGGLSKSGKDMKKLLGKSAGLIETGGPAAPDDDGQPESGVGDDDDDDDDENNMSPMLATKKKDTPKDEHVDNTPAKSASSGPTRGTPSSSKSSKSKRKAGSEDVKTANGVPVKKAKSDNEPKISVKEEIPTSSKSTATPKASSSPSSKIEQTPSNAPVTEAEIRSALLQKAPMTTQDLVAIFKPRLKSQKDKAAFAEILRKISKIQKTNGQNYVVLREKQ